MKRKLFYGLMMILFCLVLSACAKSKTFVVSFFQENGDYVQIFVEQGKTIPKDKFPILSDTSTQIFVGWEYSFYDENGEEQTRMWKDTDIVESDIILEDVWRYRERFVYKVHYNNSNNLDTTFDAREGNLIVRPSEPTMDGYEFVGWFTDEEYTQEWNFDQDKIYENIDLYAKWNDLYGSLSVRIQDEYLTWNKIDKSLDIYVNGVKKVSSVTSGKILLSNFNNELTSGETYLIELKNGNQLFDYIFYNKEIQNSNSNFNLNKPSNLKVDGGILTWNWTGDANALKCFEVYFGATLVAEQLTPSFDLKEQLKDLDANFKIKITVIAKSTRPYFYSSKPSTLNFENKMKEYDVTFVYNGQQKTVKTVNGKITDFTPTISGQVFNGWYTSSDDGMSLILEWNSSQIVKQNITLYADFVERIVESGKTVLSSPKISVNAGGIYWDTSVLDSQSQTFEYILYGYNSNGQYEQIIESYVWSYIGEESFVYYIQEQIEEGLNEKIKLDIRNKGNGENTLNSAWVTRYISLEIQDKEAYLNEDIGIFYWQEFAENYKIEISQNANIVFETEQEENELKVPQNLTTGNYTIKITNNDSNSNGEYIFSSGNILTLATPSSVNINLNNNRIYIQLSEYNENFSYFYNIYYGENKIFSDVKIYNYSATIDVPEKITTIYLEIFVKDDNANYFVSNSAYYLLENLNSEEDFIVTGLGLVSNEDMFDFSYEYNADLQGMEILSYNGNQYKIVAIPSHINEIPVVKIGYSAFGNNNNVKIVILPSTIKEIGNFAFYNTSLIYINLPEGLEKIGNYAFYMHYELTNLVLPTTLLYIGDSAFFNVPFRNLILPSNLQYVGTQAFNSEIEFVIIPYSIEFLGKAPFGYSSKILLMPSTLDTSSWDEEWFNSSKDTVWNNYVGNYETEKYKYFVYDNNKVFLYGTKIESNANQIVNLKEDFNDEGLELVYIGGFTFAGIYISEVILPDTLKYVGSHGFESCHAEIIVPASVEYAGEHAFWGNDITVLGDTSYWED